MILKYTGDGKKDVSIPYSYKIFFDVMQNKIYEILSVEKGWYRIIDKSDEDYLYPQKNLKWWKFNFSRRVIFNSAK